MEQETTIRWWVALIELIAALCLLIGSILVMGGATGVIWLGPLGTPLCVLLISPLLWRRGESWKSLGLGKFDNFNKTLLQAFALAVVGLVVLIAVSQLLSPYFVQPEGSLLADVAGNVWVYLYFLVIVSWLSQGLGEELLFRGFIQRRSEQMFGKLPGAAYLAVALQALLFGWLHSYQGPAGMIATGCIGAVFGLAYVRFKRKLWPLVLAHAMCGAVLVSWEFFGG